MVEQIAIPWWKQKTTITAILGALGALAGVLTGEMSWVSAIGAIMAALTGVFMRQGIEKAKVNPTMNAALRGDANITG